MKKINLLNILLICLILMGTALQAKENNIKIIQNITQIDFVLDLQFPNKTYILNSSDKGLKEKLEKLKDEDFSKLQTRTLSALAPVDGSFATIIPKTEIKNIRGAFESLLSAATEYYQGVRELKLDEKNTFTITHTESGTLLLSTPTSNITGTHYQIRNDYFIENLVILVERPREELSAERSDYTIFQQTANKELETVSQFLNAQSCLALRQCSKDRLDKNESIIYQFSDFKEEAQTQFLLGLYFESHDTLYRFEALTELFLIYLEKASNEQNINQVLLRLESYINHSTQDPYTSRKQLKHLLEKLKSKKVVYNKLLLIDKEFGLNPIFTSEISDMSEKVERTKHFINKLINPKYSYLLYSTQFEVDVLRMKDDVPLDSKLIDYKLFYELFKSALLEQKRENGEYRASSYPMDLLVFLSKNNEDEFMKSLVLDMNLSAEFKSALEFQFKEYRDTHDENKELTWKFLIKVEDAYKYKSLKIIQESMNALQVNMKEKMKNRIIKREKILKVESLLEEWKDKYKTEGKNHKIFYEDIYKNLKESPSPTEHALTVADLFTKLIIIEMKNKDFPAGKKLVMYYIDKLLPLVGAHEKTTDLSSNGIVLSIYSKDAELSQAIFDKLLGKDFKIEEITNLLLVYNIACHYAINKEKKPMLSAIRQSLNLGMKSQQFIKDSDFKAYLEDEDFISTLKKN